MAGVLDTQPKVGQFATNLLREFDATRSVHDIWQGRAFGYPKPDGTPWDAGFTEQQHKFMDLETDYLIDQVNREKAGGFTDWDHKNTQAAAWVGARKKASTGDEAKSYGDFANQNTVFAPYEQVPMSGGGNLGEMASQPPEVRKKYSEAVSWKDRNTGKNVLWDAFRLLTGETKPYYGAYTGSDGKIQYNPGEVTPVLVGWDSIKKMDYGPLPEGVKAFDKTGKIPVPTGTKRVDKASSDLINAFIELEGVIDFQEAVVANITNSSAKAREKVGVDVQTKSGKPVTQEEFALLAETADKYGFFAVDRGNGTVSFINNEYSVLGEERLKNVNAGETPELFAAG